MKILVVSGFLGAGKTTFIKALARQTGKDFAILENEYGADGIDGDDLRDSMAAGGLSIWELAEGCICCSMKGDFAASVLTIANSVDPEYLVIEPTGVGMLSNILFNLSHIEYERITLLAPITIVDFHSCERYLQEFPDLYLDQITSAHTVIVSKTEQAGAEEKDRIKTKLKKCNPGATVITEPYGRLDNSWYMDLLERGFDGSLLKSPRSSSQELPDSFSVSRVSMDSPEKLLILLEGVIHGEFGDILRAKGYLQAGNHMFRFDVADGRYVLTGMETGRKGKKGKAVFIGSNILRQKLRRSFTLSSKAVDTNSSTAAMTD